MGNNSCFVKFPLCSPLESDLNKITVTDALELVHVVHIESSVVSGDLRARWRHTVRATGAKNDNTREAAHC